MEIENTNDNLFSTRDLSLAATLMTLGFNLMGVDYQREGSRPLPVGYFKFEISTPLLEAEKKFWKGELAVDPRAFMVNVHSLKARVTDAYNSPHKKV